MALIPLKNKFALISYYAAVFSLIPIIGIILGPTAMITGLIGYIKYQNNKQIEGLKHSLVGIILGAVTTLLQASCITWLVVSIITD